MKVRIQLTDEGKRAVGHGHYEIRGTTEDRSGKHWSVRIEIDRPITNGFVTGVATFLLPGIEEYFTDEFEVVRGRNHTMMRCTPLHGHD